jgi:hypothetical protein
MEIFINISRREEEYREFIKMNTQRTPTGGINSSMIENQPAALVREMF